MGREIRRVPPNWEHPKNGPYERRTGDFHPMYKRRYIDACKEWKEGYAEWERGERPDYCGEENSNLEYWDWEGRPPDKDFYAPDDYTEDRCTWYQYYENVSEGTPLSPPFETPEELARWLSENRDFCGKGPMSYEAALHFIGVGWAPSMIFSPETGALDSNAIIEAKGEL